MMTVKAKRIIAVVLALVIAFSVLAIPVHSKILPTGKYFDHIVIIAMENKVYSSVMGTGTGTASTPFLNTTLAAGATIPNYNGYSSGAQCIDSTGGCTPPPNTACSAACYTAVTSGNASGVSDGVASGSVNRPNIFSALANNGLTWKAYCENGCPRHGDHFPTLQYANTYRSPNSIITSQDFNNPASPIYAELNSSSSANLIWLTPTDSHNMHDNSISSGDAYLKSLLVGTGTLSSPSIGSVLATKLFQNPFARTLLFIWWDESATKSTPLAANVLYGPSVTKTAYISSATGYDEYALLHTMEDNWNIPAMTTSTFDFAAPTMTDLFSLSGNYGACTSLPQGWYCNPVYAPSGTGTATIVNGVLNTTLNNVAGSDNAPAYATTQRGTFPWTPCSAPASGVLGQTTGQVSASFKPVVLPTPSTGRYHIYVALYYYLNHTVTSGGHTFQCLDTQARVQYVNGAFSQVNDTGHNDTCQNPSFKSSCYYSNAFGWEQVEIGKVVYNSLYTLAADVATQAQNVLAAWNISTTGLGYKLSGVEVGIEGWGFTTQSLAVSWPQVSIGPLRFVSVVVSGDNLTPDWNALSNSPWVGWKFFPNGGTASAPVLCPSKPGSGLVDLIVRGTDNASIWHNRFTNGSWSGWDGLNGQTNAQPACAYMGGALYVVMRGLDTGAYWNKLPDGQSTWSGWQLIPGGVLGSSPVLAASQSRLDLAVLGTSNTVYHTAFVNGAWTSWDTPQGAATSPPAIVGDGSNLHMIIRGNSNEVQYNSMPFNTGVWSGWVDLCGSTAMAPALTIDGSGVLHAVVTGMDNSLYQQSKSPGVPWPCSPWTFGSGRVYSAPSVATSGTTVGVLVIGGSQSIWYNSFVGGTWQGWVSLNGMTNRTPAIVSVP